MSELLARINGSLPLIFFLMGQAAALVIWGARLDGRVGYIEQRAEALERHVAQMDDGLRKLAIIEERQNGVLHRMDTISSRIDALEILKRLPPLP